MSAFVLILVALISRMGVLSTHWFNFTAVGGSLLYFGARRPLRQAAWAIVPFMAMDVFLTTRVYRMPFHAQDYLITWLWYAAALVLGSLLLKQRTNVTRVVSGSLLASTSFFAVSNYAVWVGSGMYPHTLGGLTTCYASALPFYRNDLVSTLLVTGVAFGVEALVRRSRQAHAAGHGQIAA
ncbi:MAG TPA: DUF6580 family putative transport protein [Acidobacteriaceae bacterium]|jgi:hypothetical protein